MASIGELVISLRADIAQFRTSMDEAKQGISQVQSQFATATEYAKAFVDVLGGFLATREVANILKESAEATRSWAEQLSTFQGLAGLSSTAAATLAASTQIAGVQTDVVNAAMARLGTTIATHPQKFEQLGIAIRDSSGQLLPMTTILRNTIAGLDEFKAGTDRAAAAGFLFGRGAETWITQLDKLGPELKSANWAENEALVKGLGLAMEDGKAKAEEWARAEGTLKLELLGVENQIGSALLPVLETLGSEVAKYAKNGDLNIWAEDAARAVLSLTIGLAELVDFFVQHNQVFGTISAVAGGAAFLETGSTAGLAAFLAGWKATGTGADEAAAKVHAATLKMIADLKGAQKQIGVTQPGATATGEDAGAGEGTKSFSVPDPHVKQLDDSIAKLTADYERHIYENQQLVAAMAQSKDAAKALSDQFQAEDKIMAIRAEALRLGVTLTDAQAKSLEDLALKEGASKDLLEKETQLRTALDESMKKQREEMDKLVESADSLTDKERKLADQEGLLIQAFDRGLISADQFNQKLRELQTAFNGPDKGWQEFTKGLSTDLSTLINKMTDVQALLAESGKKGGLSVFQQLTNDTNAFVKSLGDLLLKLLVINPLLNALGLGDQGNGKQLPTLYGPTNTSLGGSSGGISGLLSWFSGLFGGTGAKAAAGADAASTAAGASVNSDIIDALTAGAFGGFANGGEFVVGGIGGVDSQLVAFKATPGEKVSVGQNTERRSTGDVHHHHYNYSPTFITPNADSFKKTAPQHGADAMRQMRNAGRYV